MKDYYVYIMTNDSGTVLYTGVTNNLSTRVAAHAAGVGCKFTRKYRCNRLVYFETYQEITQAIAREKQIKGWSRNRKEALIRSTNPELINAALQL